MRFAAAALPGLAQGLAQWLPVSFPVSSVGLVMAASLARCDRRPAVGRTPLPGGYRGR